MASPTVSQTPPAAPTTKTVTPQLPTTPARSVTDKDLVAASPLLTPTTPPSVVPATPEAKKTLAELLSEHFVRVDDLRSSGNHFPFRGRCEKCGWHTHQFAEHDARQLTILHVQQHWRDVTRFM